MPTTVTQVKDCEHGHDGYATRKFCVTCASKLLKELLESPQTTNGISGRVVISVEPWVVAEIRALFAKD